MQLALFQSPPAERRRPSTSSRAGASSRTKKGRLELRVQRRPGTPPPRSAPGLSFLKPQPPEQEKPAPPSAQPRPPRSPHRPHPTRGKLLPPEILTATEVQGLIEACSTRGMTGHRNRALLAILWRTGLRISEALDLRPHDIDAEHGTVRVRCGKGLKPRTTVLSSLDALPLLRRWEALRARLPVGKGTPLFCTTRGTPIDTSYVRHLLPRLAEQARIERRVHPHALRHTHAADLALSGVSVLAIQHQLGHASLATTADYLRRVGVRLDLAQAIRPEPEPELTELRTVEPPSSRSPAPSSPVW